VTKTESFSPLATARSFGEELRARSVEIDDGRRLPADLVHALTEAGLFRFWVPKQYGGPETPVLEGLDTFIELARHDAATAWCVFIANTSALLSAFMDPACAREVYGRPDAITGGFAQPMGRATPIDGGLRVSGRWQWGSGTQHCSHVGGGIVVVDADGRPAPRADGLRIGFAFFEPVDVEFIDTWHVLGLQGTGSTDYAVHDAFVPEGRWADLGNRHRFIDAPLYRFSFFGLLAAGVGCTLIGLAARAVEEFRALALVKTPQNSRRTLAERESAQQDLARADATVRSTQAFLHDVVGDAWDSASRGDELTIEQRRVIRLAITDAAARCTDTVNRLYRAAGGEAVYERTPLERLLRDANVASQHAMAAERTYELAGRIGFGLDTDTSLL
jgi:alkylation response protein AidB-like acyl-CoA dehydrogenase